MDSTLKALIVKKFKDSELDLAVGRQWIDETVVLRVSGTVERHEDQWILPTVSIPLIPTIASRDGEWLWRTSSSEGGTRRNPGDARGRR